ncbi:MAG TPA: DUF1684 domain-containing protein [Pyrinomonadaceae bacterium]|nr:DUF1684 domain-containing protein [Pyrinomonadaceae bacterium]
MTRRVIGALFILTLLSVFGIGQSAYDAEVSKWRAEYQAKLTSDTGWITLAGLFWLKEGENTVGKGENFDVKLTENFPKEKFGEIDFHDGKATLKVENGVEASSSGVPVSTIELLSGEKGKPTIIEAGSQTFFLIKRENRYGIRLKDKQNPKLKSFAGLHWYPVANKLRVDATFERFDEPKEILVPNVLGGSFKYNSPGLLKFKIGGKEYSLQPVEEEDKLFIIFRDQSSRSETYGAGRFLYADKPVDGKVILDFNKAENPPCAYTPYATCPLPPPQNRLDVEIKAGEKRFDH